MGKKSSGLSVRGRPTKQNAKIIPDDQIDFSDIPPLTDEQMKKMVRPGRPLLGGGKRQIIAIRLDPSVLRRLKLEADEEGKGYQTLINEILGKHVKKSA